MSEQESVSFQVWLEYDLAKHRVTAELVLNDRSSRRFEVEHQSVWHAEPEVHKRLTRMGYETNGWTVEAEDSNGPLVVSSCWTGPPDAVDLASL